MFRIVESTLKELVPLAKILIDQELDSIEYQFTSKITIILIRASKAKKAYEQGLVISAPIKMYDEEFLVLRAPIKKEKSS